MTTLGIIKAGTGGFAVHPKLLLAVEDGVRAAAGDAIHAFAWNMHALEALQAPQWTSMARAAVPAPRCAPED